MLEAPTEFMVLARVANGQARTNRNHEVRKQAMFWLGQSKDTPPVQFFAEILAAK